MTRFILHWFWIELLLLQRGKVCVCILFNLKLFFFVIGKVLSQQFLIDQHVEIAPFFHIVVFRKSLLNKTAYVCSVFLSASPSQLSDCKIFLDKQDAYWCALFSLGSLLAPLRAVRQICLHTGGCSSPLQQPELCNVHEYPRAFSTPLFQGRVCYLASWVTAVFSATWKHLFSAGLQTCITEWVPQPSRASHL